MIYTTLNRYENDCLPGWDVSLWRSYRITMQITPANMYANHSPIEYASLKIIRAWMSLLSKYISQSHAFYIHWQRRSYSLNTYGRRRPVLSQKDVWNPYPIIELGPARSCLPDYAWYENESVAGWVKLFLFIHFSISKNKSIFLSNISIAKLWYTRIVNKSCVVSKNYNQKYCCAKIAPKS